MIITCENCDSSFRVPKDAIGESGRFVKCTSCDHEWLVKPEALDLTTDTSEVPEAKATEATAVTEASEAEKVESDVKPESSEPSEEPVPAEKDEGKKDEAALAKDSEKEEKSAAEKEAPVVKKKIPKRFVAPPEPIHKRKWCRYTVYMAFAASLLLMLTQVAINNHMSFAHTSGFVNKMYEFAGMHNIEGLVLQKVDCTINEIRSSRDLGDNIEVEVDAYIKNISDEAKVLNNIRFTLFDIDREYVGDLVMEIGNTVEPGEDFHIEGVLNRVPKNSYYVSIDYGNYIELIYKNMNILHD